MLGKLKQPPQAPEKRPVQLAMEGLDEAFEKSTKTGEVAREEILRAFVAGVRLGSTAAFDHARRTAEMYTTKTNASLDLAFTEIEGFIGHTMNRLHTEPMESPAALAKRFGTTVAPAPTVKPINIIKGPASDIQNSDEVLELTNILEGIGKEKEAVK